MTLVSHEKLSDCYNLTCNEGKVSNWGEGKKGEGLGRVSSLPFSPLRFPPPLPSPSLCVCDQIFKRPILLIAAVSHFLAINICFTCDCAGQDRKIRSRAFHKLLGTFLATARISSNFLHSDQVLQLSSSSEISKQLLVLKLTFLSYFTMSQQTIYEFPVKREPNPPPWGRSWAAVFRENSKWWTKILTRLSEEGHSAILLAHYIFWI